MAATTGLGQEVWRKIPVSRSGPQDPDLRGAVIDARATINNNCIDSRVVVSGAHQTGSYSLGFWVSDLFDLIPERVFWPYMGPDLGKEALNPNMAVITLYKKHKKSVFNFRLGVNSGGNYPQGAYRQKEDDMLTTFGPKKQNDLFIANMASGFDYGIATIGHGVFKHPIEIKFSGKGIEQPLNELIGFVGKPKIKPFSPPKTSPGKSPH